MKHRIIPLAVLLLWRPIMASTQQDVVHRLDVSAAVFSEIMSAPDKGIPVDLLEKAHCVVIVPGLKKGAFIVGAQYGKGFITCRQHGAWSAPGSVRIEGGSFGLQAGGSETDLVLMVMNARGADRLLSSHFTLGGEGEVAAGPVGRSAAAETRCQVDRGDPGVVTGARSFRGRFPARGNLATRR